MYYVIRPFDLIKVNKNHHNFGLIFIILWYQILPNQLKKFKNLNRWYDEISNRDAVKRGYDLLKKGDLIPKA